METLDALAREGDGRTVMLSCELDLGIDWLLESIWRVSFFCCNSGQADQQGIGTCQVCSHRCWGFPRQLTFRVYTKKRGDQPDLSDPICLRPGATIETVCHGIHRSLASHFKSVISSSPMNEVDSRYALVWGKSSKFCPQPQKVGLTHLVHDEDV